MRHVFRLLKVAKQRNRPVPWLLLENVGIWLSSIHMKGKAHKSRVLIFADAHM